MVPQVRSYRERKFDVFRALYKEMANHLKTMDWDQVQTDFDKMQKAYNQATLLIKKEGNPRDYVRSLVELEDAIANTTRGDQKDMNKSKVRAFNRVKRELKKLGSDATLEADKEAYRKVSYCMGSGPPWLFAECTFPYTTCFLRLQNPDAAIESSSEEEKDSVDTESEAESEVSASEESESGEESDGDAASVGSDDSVEWDAASESDSESDDERK